MLVDEPCLLGTYCFVYLNVLQEMKRERFLSLFYELEDPALEIFVLFYEKGSNVLIEFVL